MVRRLVCNEEKTVVSLLQYFMRMQRLIIEALLIFIYLSILRKSLENSSKYNWYNPIFSRTGLIFVFFFTISLLCVAIFFCSFLYRGVESQKRIDRLNLKNLFEKGVWLQRSTNSIEIIGRWWTFTGGTHVIYIPIREACFSVARLFCCWFCCCCCFWLIGRWWNSH